MIHSTKLPFLKKNFLLIMVSLLTVGLSGSCPPTTPWTTPINLSNSGNLASSVFSAATAAGFMAVWADSSNNAHYSFSPDGVTWSSGLVTAASGNVASNSDVFVAGNATGFMVAWVDNENNGWSSFSANNGVSWSPALQINPSNLPLNTSSDVYIAGGSSGFVAAMIGCNDNNAYVSFSPGTTAWSSPVQVTTDGSVSAANQNSVTGRGFVSVAIAGQSCMLSWLNIEDPTESAYFQTINPFSPSQVTVYPVVNVGFMESACIVTQWNNYFMAAARANQGVNGQVYISTATTPSNWATFSFGTTNQDDQYTGPWVAANAAGFMITWIGDNQSPVWMISKNFGFNWTPVCSILQTPSDIIQGPVALSANSQGFVATWFDTNDSNGYASFYATPLSSLPVSIPTQVQGSAQRNVFLSQTEYLNVITWSAPVDGTALSYSIYRDAQLTDLAATIAGTATLQYVDHNVQEGTTSSYYIVAADALGNVSQAVSISITA